jgi:hypothetical protein
MHSLLCSTQPLQQGSVPAGHWKRYSSSCLAGFPATAALRRTNATAAKRNGDLSAINSASSATQLSQALRKASAGPKPSTAAALAVLQQLSKLYAAQSQLKQQKARQNELQQQAELAGRLLAQLAPGISKMSVG